MKPITNIVVYRDSINDKAMYFGPFVSRSIADYFKANLPKPTETGVKRVIQLQPYTQYEGHLVAKGILQRRAKAHV